MFVCDASLFTSDLNLEKRIALKKIITDHCINAVFAANKLFLNIWIVSLQLP